MWSHLEREKKEEKGTKKSIKINKDLLERSKGKGVFHENMTRSMPS